VEGFVGRSKELKKLHEILTGGHMAAAITQRVSPTVRGVISGLGGIGKTSLARQYVEEFGHTYDDFWWLEAESPGGIAGRLSELARILGATGPELEGGLAAGAALRRLRDLKGNYLLVYDNVAEPNDIKNLLPVSGAKVVITSRYPDWGDTAKNISLGLFSPKVAVAYLIERSGKNDPKGATALAETLGYLPLALNHAAMFCKTQMGFPEYNLRVLELLNNCPANALYPKAVWATFDISLNAANRNCPPAATLMDFIAYCAPERIPLELMRGAGGDDDQRALALDTLTNLALIQFDPFGNNVPAWRAHRIVQAVARSRSVNPLEAIKLIGKRLNEIFPDNSYDETDLWPASERLIPHMEGVFEAATSNQIEDDFSKIFDLAGLHLLSLSADRMLTHRYIFCALQFRRSNYTDKKDKNKRRKLARSISNMSLFLHESGDLKSSEILCVEAEAYPVDSGDPRCSG
jgi:hypothetical protein